MKRIPFYTVLALTLTALFTAVTNNLASNTNAPTVNAQIPTAQSKQSLPTRAEIDAMEDQSLQKVIKSAREQSARMMAERSKPIAFYGKVVDEETQAIAGASVHFMWVDPVSTSETNVMSASDGSFSLTGVVGGTVNVDVWKTGYYVVKSLKQYNFDNIGNGSSQDNPVLFHLRKKGVGSDLISAALNVKIPLDGTSTSIDFLNQSSGAGGQLQLSQIKPPYENWKKATAWSFRMTIPDGGFVEENDEFPFEAPENGYQPVIEFAFKAGHPDWKIRFTKNYYIVFGNPPRYGNLTVQTDIMWGGARISYAVNPTGSRNLEATAPQ